MFRKWKISFFYSLSFIIISFILFMQKIVDVSFINVMLLLIIGLLGYIISIILDFSLYSKIILLELDTRIKTMYDELFYMETTITGNNKFKKDPTELKNLIQSILLISDAIIRSEENESEIIKKMENIKEIAFKLNTIIDNQ